MWNGGSVQWPASLYATFAQLELLHCFDECVLVVLFPKNLGANQTNV